MLTIVKILLSILMSMIIYLPSWSENCLIVSNWKLLLNNIQTSGACTGIATKKSGEAHYEAQRDSFSLVQWTCWRKKIPYFFILSQRKVSRLFRKLDRPLTFKEQITNLRWWSYQLLQKQVWWTFLQQLYSNHPSALRKISQQYLSLQPEKGRYQHH